MTRKTHAAARDHYATLEVHPGARQEVLHAARNALLKIYHTDIPGGDLERAQDIEEAYQTLSDPQERKRYDEAKALRVGDELCGFRIGEFIAEGGFGKTFKGVHVLTGMPVCIKDCSNVKPEFHEALIQEAQAMWDLRHYAIPAVRHIVQTENGSPVLIMSYIPGHTLAKYIETHNTLEPEHVAWIAERVLNALNYIHFHGVIHGDLKPQNIIVQAESHMAVLVDFGLSLVKPTRKSGSKGYTKLFAPPESINGDPLLPETDLYSLGVTMIYALGGMQGLKQKQVPRDTPKPLRHFISRLIVHDVLERPQWDKEDLCDTIRKVREESFGRTRSSLKPLPSM